MTTCGLSEAKPKLGALTRLAAADKQEAPASFDVPAINRRLAASEGTPSAPWNPGDAGRLAKQFLRKQATR